MAYEKKILVLKQTDTDLTNLKSRLSGIMRIEWENGVTEFHLSLINLPKEITGEYYLMFVDGNKSSYHFYLGKTPSGASNVFSECPNFKSGVACGIYSVKEGIPLTLAFARDDGFNYSLLDFKKLVAEKCLSERKRETKKEEPLPTDAPFSPSPIPEPSPVKPPYPPAPCPDPKVTPPDEFNKNKFIAGYDDEAVATLNYYELDENIQNKLKAVKEIDFGDLPLKNELPFSADKKETKQERICAYRTQNETDFDNCKETPKGDYYNSVKDELITVFSTHDQEDALMKVFSDSKFVKIFYSKEKYYVVGVIKENNTEKYICYGVPATYSPEPPKELKGFCSFIPLSVFDMKGKGYWMMFQSATTGECIKIETV